MIKLKTKIILFIFISTLGLITLCYIISSFSNNFPKNTIITKILVVKSKREMFLYSNNRIITSYHISLGFRPKGKKHFKGDGKTPEGLYKITAKNYQSVAYKSLRISYPNNADLQYAQRYKKDAGGDIMIHGLMGGYNFFWKFHTLIDWTGGCIAVTNQEMDELFDCVKIGTPIEINP